MKKLIWVAVLGIVVGTVLGGLSVWLSFYGVQESFINYSHPDARSAGAVAGEAD